MDLTSIRRKRVRPHDFVIGEVMMLMSSDELDFTKEKKRKKKVVHESINFSF